MGQSDRWLSLSLRLVLLGLFVWMVGGLLTPVALGGLFALLLHPLDRRLRARLGKRGSWSPLVITLGAIVLGVIPLGLLSAKLVTSINSFLASDWASKLDELRAFVAEKIAGYERLFNADPADAERLGSSVETLVRQVASATAGMAGGIAMALPGQLLDLFLFLASLYYFLRDGSSLTRWLLALSPFPQARTEELFASIQETVNGAVLGLMATSAVQGGLSFLALYIFEVPGAFLLGVLATFLALIPMVGTTPVMLGSVVYLLAAGRPGAAAGMAVAALVVGISDNVVRPWVQSSQSSMHPLLVLLGLFGGLEAFGAFGVFLGPVVAAMAVWTVRTYSQLHLNAARGDGALTSATAEGPPPLPGEPL